MNIHRQTAVVVVAVLAVTGAVFPHPSYPRPAWVAATTVFAIAAVAAANYAVTGDPLTFPDDD